MLTTATENRAGATSAALTVEDVARAARVIGNHVRRTPTVSHRLLSRRFGAPVYVKLENNQLLGSFKLRGWISLFASLDEEARRRGIVTAADGEHSRPLAAAAEHFGVAYKRVVAPESGSAPRVVRSTDLVIDAADHAERVRTAREVAERSGARFVDPAAEQAWIAGVGSLGGELVEQAGTFLDIVFVPIGTGALATGVAAAIRGASPRTRIYGVQVQDGHESAPRGSLNLTAGLAVRRSERTERTLDALLHRRLTVTEPDLHYAIRCYGETLRQAASGPGAAALAGVRQVRESLAGATIGVVLSGGNIDIWALRRVLHGEPAEDSTSELRELVGHVYR